jgi:hypothetical protein
MNTTNTTTNTTTIPDSWGDLLKLDQPLNFEAFLKSDLLAARRNVYKTFAIITHTSGSVSIIASACLAVHILRSHHGLSTTYHRLVFGLSVADIMSSFVMAIGSPMVPKEMNYVVPGAQGNTATCTTQGFLVAVGIIAAALYNCSICLYYLVIIRYNKKDAYIRNKLEPWFHGISIIGPLMGGFILISMKAYNVNDSTCFIIPNDPPHCIGYENGDTPKGFSIPCGRGDGGENPILYLVTVIVGFGSVLIVTPTVIIGTMLLMYRSVSKIEKNMRNYGVNALRLNARSEGGNRGENAETNSTRGATNDQTNGSMRRIKRFFICMIPRCLHRDDQPCPTSRSNSRATSQKRAILHMATGYALAWAFVFIPFAIAFFFLKSDATLILASCLTPLQGLFNFLVFMSPNVRSAKQPRRGNKNLTWRQAFIKAYMSRGERRRAGRNLSSVNTRTGNRVSAWKQRVQRSLKSLLSRTRSTRDTRSNQSNACTTNDQSSTNKKQFSAPAEKLTLSNPHLADDMKEAEGNNAMRPQQEGLLATDGDDEEKCEEQCIPSHQTWRSLNKS